MKFAPATAYIVDVTTADKAELMVVLGMTIGSSQQIGTKH